jgi:CRISPR-associated protein Csx10
MKEYKLIIHLESDTLIGAAGGHGTIIDTEVIFDPFGVPFIPGKRIKGLLRDSAMEIAAMYNALPKSIDNQMNDVPLTYEQVEKIFGKAGSDEFSNFYLNTDFHIAGYDLLSQHLRKEQLSVEMVKRFFTETISQTAIDEDTGSATEGSLRKLRVIKHKLPNGAAQAFHGLIRFPEEYFDKMKLIFSNIRRMGSNRNRGLGHVQLKIEEIPEADVFELSTTDSTEAGLPDTALISDDAESTLNSQKGLTHYFELYLTTLQKVVIRDNGSDENMVSSLEYIQGSNIMGLAAQKYFETGKQKEEFANLFLKGKLQFTNAYPCGQTANVKMISPFPQLYQIEANKLYVGKRNKDEDGYIVLNQYNKWLRLKTNMVLSIHHQRNLKTGKVDEIIYNYQAIAPWQRFRSVIIGSEIDLVEMLKMFKKGTTVKIGASQTAEYGSCMVELGDIKELTADFGYDASHVGDYLMVLISDTIIYNDKGFPSSNVKDLENYFETDPTNKLTIKPSKTRLKRVENYIKVSKGGLGERCHEGFGQLVFLKKGEAFDALVSDTSGLKIEYDDSKLFNELKQWVNHEELKNKLSLIAMQDAEGFVSAEMGNFARQLLQLFKVKEDLTEVIEALSPVAKKKLEKFDDKSGKSLINYFKQIEDEKHKEINNSLQETLAVDKSIHKMLKKHFYTNFLTSLHLSNKAK